MTTLQQALPAEPMFAAPLRSEGFYEDLPGVDTQVESPWGLREAGLATLLCAVPVVAATLGSLVSLMGSGA